MSAHYGSYFGSVPHDFSLCDVQCEGTETRLQDCGYTQAEDGGGYGAGVFCGDGADYLRLELRDQHQCLSFLDQPSNLVASKAARSVYL